VSFLLYQLLRGKLRLLHWLSIRQRVDFKVATLVHRSLSGNSASYLADDCRLVADARERRLRSTESRIHASLPGPTAPLVTELLQLPVPGMEQFTAEMLTYRTVGSGGH